MIQHLTPQDLRLSIHPGEWYFGNEYTSLYTILGSCVALSVWHPTLKIGGLCHYLLPAQPRYQTDNSVSQSEGGRYGKTALMLMKQAMERYAPCNEYQLGLFGGCETIVNCDIGKQNIFYARHWLEDQHLQATQIDVGGTSSRSLLFDMGAGVINLKYYAMHINDLPTK